MGILFGLLTALSWGSSDFLARFSAHRIGALRTTLYMQLTGFVLLTIFLRWIGGWGHLADGSGWQPWAWGVLAGILNGIASLSLYRSFELGKMAVVAPISASYPVLTVALSLLTGEHLTVLRVAGIVLTLTGVVLVAAGENSPNKMSAELSAIDTSPATEAAGKKAGSGVGWAFLSALGFGVLFWLLGTRVVPSVGYAATVWMIRLTSSLLTVAVILVLRQPLALPRGGPVPAWLLGMGLLDTCAFVLNNRGMQLEQVSVVSVLASLYGAFTVALAAIFLRERLARWQWLGIVAIFAGIVLISR
ncbi:MAG TPA: EamA family transporter [Candidatus Acidoferrum sp.]|nr:EamA family transporter [Candidatus Acidoferrum sp.]